MSCSERSVGALYIPVQNVSQHKRQLKQYSIFLQLHATFVYIQRGKISFSWCTIRDLSQPQTMKKTSNHKDINDFQINSGEQLWNSRGDNFVKKCKLWDVVTHLCLVKLASLGMIQFVNCVT